MKKSKAGKLISKLVLTIGAFLLAVCFSGCQKESTAKNTEKVTAPKDVTKILTKEKFSNLKIKSQNADVIIETGKDYRITYQGKSSTVPAVKTSKNQIVINQDKARHALGIMKLPKIIIQVPEDKKLADLNVETDSADVRINQIDLKSAQITSDSGDIIVSSSQSSNGMKLISTTGDIKVRKTGFSGYRLTTKDGQIQVKNRSVANSYVKKTKSKNVLIAQTGSREIWIQ